jgi:hypothetical protein
MSVLRPSHRTSFFVAALLAGASIPACAFVAQADLAAAGGGGNMFTGGATGSTGAGGTPQDGSIEISPDSAGIDPSKPFASLCAAGECAIGGADCAPGAGGVALPMSCSLAPAIGAAVAACTPAGSFAEGEPCNSADNCASGLGCASTANGGVCRSYCCGDVELCPMNTYCDLQPMAEDTLNTPQLSIPVCVPTTNCELLNDAMTCPAPLTCTIVRADGTTSCVVPGAGVLNDPCPCAAGYVCSKLNNECKKLCHIGQDAVDCDGTGSCLEVGPGFPAGFGVCSPASK